ncbi:MAG: glycerophosphodiester phosphodiesterase family protein [Enterobacteriaceae bacterium]
MKKICAVVLILLTCFVAAVYAVPLTVAHRGGTADYPENTLLAIRKAIENKADIIWISVQLSQDQVVVLYRPVDLNSLTNGQGQISRYTYAELARLDAAYQFGREQGYPWRAKGVTIPTLTQVLAQFPEMTFFIDIKSPDADPAVMAKALYTAIGNQRQRVVIYSTEKRYLTALPAALEQFVDRDLTREALAQALLSRQCILSPATKQTLYAFELNRKVELIEKMTLGEGRSMVNMVWDRQAMRCFKQTPFSKVLLIGIDSRQTYQQAASLGADYIMVDSPAQAQQWRSALPVQPRHANVTPEM